jgi:hypothetical protein
VSIAVGKEGKLKQRMAVPGAVGGWADEVAAVNTLIDDLVWPTTEVTRAIGAVAKGDLGQSMALEVDGRLQIAVTDNGQGISPSFLPYVFERFRASGRRIGVAFRPALPVACGA